MQAFKNTTMTKAELLKGKAAVIHAIKFLTNLGFACSDAQKETTNGHDIIAIKKGLGYTFEVKPAVYRDRCYKISKVSKITSDGIIYVFPSGQIQIDTMKNHLKNCSKDGTRFLTFIGKIYE
jgi:hypothetical protein